MEKERTLISSMDELGRIEIPEDIRKIMGWSAGTKLEVGLVDICVRSAILREVFTRCSLCRRKTKGLLEVEGGFVCPACVAIIK